MSSASNAQKWSSSGSSHAPSRLQVHHDYSTGTWLSICYSHIYRWTQAEQIHHIHTCSRTGCAGSSHTPAHNTRTHIPSQQQHACIWTHTHTHPDSASNLSILSNFTQRRQRDITLPIDRGTSKEGRSLNDVSLQLRQYLRKRRQQLQANYSI